MALPLLAPPDDYEEGIVVELDSEEDPLAEPEPSFEVGPDGSIIVDFEPVEGGMANEYEPAHGENLAEYLEERDLAAIGTRILEMVDDDLQSREEWAKVIEDGIRKLGTVEEPEGEEPFEGASRVRHPLMAEACVQFQARAIKEMFPPKGPVKARVLGKKDREAEERRDRVEGYMNYQYTVEMPEAFEATDQLLMYLPLSGSAFKKAYPDPRLGRITTAFVRAEDLIVPYHAVDLDSSPRHTHRMRRHLNDMLKLMRSGFYRHVELPRGGQLPDPDPVRETIARAEGRDDVLSPYDDEYEILESNIEYDLPGFEDVDEAGEPTGIALPYIITVERSTMKVLSIYRNWKEGDPSRKKRVWFTHYKYLPGLGFYGHGLLHMIGGLNDAATGALRALLDSAQFANLQGGFRRKQKGSKSGTVVVSPGHWEDVETAGDLREMFMPLPYKEPSTVLFQLLGFLTEAAQRFASIADAMVGDADNKGPVGTTLALIEQGSKVFSSIHKRLHNAQANEFKLVKELNAETLEGPYPYQVEGEDRVIMPEDFRSIDVVPASDPNVYSNTQRIAQAQAGLQLAQSNPQIHNLYEAYRRMYVAMEMDPEGVLIDPDDVPRMDPLTENMAMMNGKAVKAFPDQAHDAHLMVHQAWFASLPPEGQKMLQGPYMAHIAEHLALRYRTQMIAAISAQVGGFDIPLPRMRGQGPVQYEEGVELPPEVENQIAMRTAIALQQNPQLAAPMMPGQQQQNPQAAEEAKAAAEIKRKDMAAAKEQERKDAAADRENRRRDVATAAEIARQKAKTTSDVAALDAKTAAGILTGAAKAAQKPRPAPAGADA